MTDIVLLFEGLEETPENTAMTMVYDGVEITLEQVYDILRTRIKNWEAEQRRAIRQLNARHVAAQDRLRKEHDVLIRELLAALANAIPSLNSREAVAVAVTALAKAKAAGYEA